MLGLMTILLFTNCGGIRLADDPKAELANVLKLSEAEAKGDLLSLIDQTESSPSIAFAVLEDLLWSLRDGGTYEGPIPKIGPKTWRIVRALHALLVIRRDGVMTTEEVLGFEKAHGRQAVIAFHLTTGRIKPKIDAPLRNTWHREQNVLRWATMREWEPKDPAAIAEYWVTRCVGMGTMKYAIIRMGNRPDFWAQHVLTLLEASAIPPEAAKSAAMLWVRLQRHRLTRHSTPPAVISDWGPKWNMQLAGTLNSFERVAMARPARIYVWTHK